MTQRTPTLFVGLLSLGALAATTPTAFCQDFASSVASSSHLSTDPLFSDPTAALGQPATQDDDTFGDIYTVSLVNPAYGQDPSTHANLLTQLDSSGFGSLIVKFDTPIVHSDMHWYGMDFLVFGNSFFQGNTTPDGTGDPYVSPDTDLDHYYLTDGSTAPGAATLSSRNTKVFVSPDDNPADFRQVGPGTVDGAYPINPFAWVSATGNTPGHFGTAMDFSKPVNPALTPADFAGHTAAYAMNTLYDGSAGGAAFSLAGTGYTSISYIMVTGDSTVIDGFSRVSVNPAPEPSEACAFAVGVGGLALLAWRRRPRAS